MTCRERRVVPSTKTRHSGETMRRRCRDCLFLNTTVPKVVMVEGVKARTVDRSWTMEERTREADWPSRPGCSEGVWSTTVDGNIDVAAELDNNRKNECYFIKAQSGMSYQGGRDLLKRRAERRRTTREWFNLLLSAIAVVTAVSALAVSCTADKPSVADPTSSKTDTPPEQP